MGPSLWLTTVIIRGGPALGTGAAEPVSTTERQRVAITTDPLRNWCREQSLRFPLGGAIPADQFARVLAVRVAHDQDRGLLVAEVAVFVLEPAVAERFPVRRPPRVGVGLFLGEHLGTLSVGAHGCNLHLLFVSVPIRERERFTVRRPLRDRDQNRRGIGEQVADVSAVHIDRVHAEPRIVAKRGERDPLAVRRKRGAGAALLAGHVARAR